MARSYAAIHQRIWADPEWRALDPNAQLLYLLLISQPQMNLAGVLPLQLRKWASCANGWDISDVAAALDRLREARFVLVDEDTEEVLIRTLIRNDGSYKIPNVLKSLLQMAEGTQAPALRSELATELGRLDPLDGKKADESRGLIAATRLVLGASDGPSGPSREPLPEPLAEPLPEGLGEGLLVTHAVRVDSSVKQPMPEGSGSGSGSGTSLSLVRNSGGESTSPPPDEAPKCKRHDHLADEDVPPCKPCQRLRENWEAIRAEHLRLALIEAARPKPMCAEHPGQVAEFCGPCRSELLAVGE